MGTWYYVTKKSKSKDVGWRKIFMDSRNIIIWKEKVIFLAKIFSMVLNMITAHLQFTERHGMVKATVMENKPDFKTQHAEAE